LRQRIQTLDGLRFLAALGVLWVHSWTFHGNPGCHIGPINITDFLAIGGNGVDLFFVISGFCMYYFYASKSEFSYHDFYRFIKKRWVRLSPAFYAATVIYIIVHIYVYNTGISYNILSFLNSIFYLNSIFPQHNIAAHFWTLGVEWQFYFTIPFLLIYQNRIGFKKTFLIIFGLLFLIAAISVFIIKNRFDLLTDQLLFRGIEFACGILAARVVINNVALKVNRILALLFFIIVTYTGRVLISKSALNLSENYYNLFKLFGFTLMGAGFAGILYLSVTSTKWLNLVLGNRLFKTMGRISYSFYLWHGLVQPVIAIYVIKYMPIGKGMIAPIITTVASTIILYPISQLSYNILEKPFLSIGNLTTN